MELAPFLSLRSVSLCVRCLVKKCRTSNMLLADFSGSMHRASLSARCAPSRARMKSCGTLISKASGTKRSAYFASSRLFHPSHRAQFFIHALQSITGMLASFVFIYHTQAVIALRERANQKKQQPAQPQAQPSAPAPAPASVPLSSPHTPTVSKKRPRSPSPPPPAPAANPELPADFFE